MLIAHFTAPRAFILLESSSELTIGNSYYWQLKATIIIENPLTKEKYTVQLEAIDSDSAPFVITLPEFMRRMKEMQQSGGNGMFGNMPEIYNLIVNVNNPICSEILNSKSKAKKERLINQSLDLAKLSQNLLKGEELTSFIKRSLDLIK